MLCKLDNRKVCGNHFLLIILNTLITLMFPSSEVKDSIISDQQSWLKISIKYPILQQKIQ